MERCYDFHDLVNTANTLNRLSVVEYGNNGLQFGRVHNEVENIWSALHPLLDNETLTAPGDQLGISIDLEIISALKEGFKEAQAMLRVLNMAPSNQASPAKKLWFYNPWKLENEDPKHFADQPPSTPQVGLDGNAECKCERLQNLLDSGLQPRSTSNPNNVLEDE